MEKCGFEPGHLPMAQSGPWNPWKQTHWPLIQWPLPLQLGTAHMSSWSEQSWPLKPLKQRHLPSTTFPWPLQTLGQWSATYRWTHIHEYTEHYHKDKVKSDIKTKSRPFWENVLKIPQFSDFNQQNNWIASIKSSHVSSPIKRNMSSMKCQQWNVHKFQH